MLHLYIYPVKLRGMTHLQIQSRPTPGLFKLEKEVGALRLQPEHAEQLLAVLRTASAPDKHVKFHIVEQGTEAR